MLNTPHSTFKITDAREATKQSLGQWHSDDWIVSDTPFPNMGKKANISQLYPQSLGNGGNALHTEQYQVFVNVKWLFFS